MAEENKVSFKGKSTNLLAYAVFVTVACLVLGSIAWQNDKEVKALKERETSLIAQRQSQMFLIDELTAKNEEFTIYVSDLEKELDAIKVNFEELKKELEKEF